MSQIVLPDKGFIKAKVVDEQLEPLVAIVVVTREGTAVASEVTDRDGICEFALYPTAYHVTALKRNYLPTSKIVDVVSCNVTRVGLMLRLQVGDE